MHMSLALPRLTLALIKLVPKAKSARAWSRTTMAMTMKSRLSQPVRLTRRLYPTQAQQDSWPTNSASNVGQNCCKIKSTNPACLVQPWRLQGPRG